MTTPLVGVLKSSIDTGPAAIAKMPPFLLGSGPCIGIGNSRPPLRLVAFPQLVT